MSPPSPLAQSAAPVLVNHQQPCGTCGVPVHFKLGRSPLESPDPSRVAPDFITPVFPDGCWLAWVRSVADSNKLELLVVCGQTCLIDWFERRALPTHYPLTTEPLTTEPLTTEVP